MFLQIVAALATHWYAPSPEQAALNVVYSASKEPVSVQRVNVVGSYATVLTSGALIESNPVREAILLERFSFGWQALDILNVSCRLHEHALSARTESMLMKGMPKPSGNNFRMCDGRKDAGPSEDIQEVRKLEPGPLVPYVIVSRDWAVAEWYGAGGGKSLWEKRDGRWRLVQGGGGALEASDVRNHGVPESDWCTFGIADAKCHKRSFESPSLWNE